MHKRLLALVLAAVLLLSAAACAGDGNNAVPDGDNTAPVITGVADQTVTAGETFDALAGVTAEDAEDGDLTAQITVEAMPALDFQNGKAVPDKAGSYELIYSVTDQGGLTGEAYATLTVTRQTGEAQVYKTFDFSAPQTVDDHGWTARVEGAAKAEGALKDGAFVFDIQNPGEGDGEIQLAKSGVALKAAEYRVKVYAKSTKPTYAHLLARDEDAEEWSTFGAAWNLPIGEEIAPLEMSFTSNGEGHAELLLNLGKITPDAGNPSDSTPEDFTVTIDKVEFYEISGAETRNPLYEGDAAVNVSAGDGAEASADGSAAVISAYPTDGGVWSIKTDLALPGIAVEAGTKYYYSFTVTAENAQSGECLVESAGQADANRVSFQGIALEAGAETVVSGSFTADQAVADPVIRLQIGDPSDGVTSNTLTFGNLEFGLLEGDLETVKTIDAFRPFGKGTANGQNPDMPWDTFNGTDEDAERGVGTIWTDNGKFYYRIDQGGMVDWHNKLICGYSDNPLTLASDSYYVVEITARADKPVSCGFFLNTLGGWDPRISEGIDLTTEEQTFTFETTDTLIMDMDFEMLFQFGSEATAQAGEVTVEISNITIYQRQVL